MTDLLPIPVTPVIDYANEIEQAMVTNMIAVLDPLNITTIEAAYPQKDGLPRAYRRPEFPAIYLWCEPMGSEWIAGLTLNLIFRLRWGLMTYNANPQDARLDHARLQASVVAMLSSAYYQGNATIIASGAPIWIDQAAPGEPTLGDFKSPFTYRSESSFRVRVPWTDPTVGV